MTTITVGFDAWTDLVLVLPVGGTPTNLFTAWQTGDAAAVLPIQAYTPSSVSLATTLDGVAPALAGTSTSVASVAATLGGLTPTLGAADRTAAALDAALASLSPDLHEGGINGILTVVLGAMSTTLAPTGTTVAQLTATLAGLSAALTAARRVFGQVAATLDGVGVAGHAHDVSVATFEPILASLLPALQATPTPKAWRLQAMLADLVLAWTMDISPFRASTAWLDAAGHQATFAKVNATYGGPGDPNE